MTLLNQYSTNIYNQHQQNKKRDKKETKEEVILWERSNSEVSACVLIDKVESIWYLGFFISIRFEVFLQDNNLSVSPLIKQVGKNQQPLGIKLGIPTFIKPIVKL